jgi:hypothetical protein
MPTVIENAPPAVDQSGNLLILWVPTIANLQAPTATELKAAGAKRLTYSFTPDGYTPSGDQEVTKDERLSLPQDLESLGKVTAALALKYVDSDDAGSAKSVLTPGLSGYFVERRSVPNSTDIAAAQKVYIRPVTLGIQVPDAPNGTGKFTISQKVAMNGVVVGPVAVA